MRTRPVGIHRHFHVLAMRNSIHRDTGHWISADDIWEKLKGCYDLDILESIEADGYDTPGSNGSNSIPVQSPSPEDNLALHPYFREEYSLPHDEAIDNMISQRRMRASASLPSTSPVPTSPVVEKTTRSSKKGKTKSSLAGLVGGESDSSALTQESGDESITPPPRMGSVATGTDAGTEYAEDEEQDAETHAKSTRKGTSKKKSTAAARKRGTSVSRGVIKKRKR
ncbi:hypothetical protein QCA50_015246 [Cerrena zonata]|uniref:Chromatin modification-related protein EAF7 n=1 Tax=Cerrena zonata TaxID=2478898 RepID=A0AAW0FR31_9APHY